MGGVRRGGSTAAGYGLRTALAIGATCIAVVLGGTLIGEAKDESGRTLGVDEGRMGSNSAESRAREGICVDDAWQRDTACPTPSAPDVGEVERGSDVVPEVAGVGIPEVLSESVPPEPVAEPEPLVGVEAAICAYPWECSIALRVAACESGPDYVAGYNASGHAGTFQVSPIHAWRFAARGLDFWTDALTLEWNLDVAYELWTERWWYAWSCF